MLSSNDRLANTVADYIKNTFHDKKIGLWLPAMGSFAAEVQQSISSRGMKVAMLQTNDDFSVPAWLLAVDVYSGFANLGTFARMELASNPKLSVIVPAPVLYDQLIPTLQNNTRTHHAHEPHRSVFSGCDSGPGASKSF